MNKSKPKQPPVKHPVEQLPVEAVTYPATIGNKLEVITRNQRVLYDKLQAIEKHLLLIIKTVKT